MNVIEWCEMSDFGGFRHRVMFVQMHKQCVCSNGQTFQVLKCVKLCISF